MVQTDSKARNLVHNTSYVITCMTEKLYI